MFHRVERRDAHHHPEPAVSGLTSPPCNETAERAVDHPDPIALLICVLGLGLGNSALLRLLQNAFTSLRSAASVRASTDETGPFGVSFTTCQVLSSISLSTRI